MNVFRLNLWATLAVASLLGGCATAAHRSAGDPLEPMNRTIYAVNGKIDTYVAKPVASTYQKIAPAPVRTGVNNFFANLKDINNFANDALQLKPRDSSEDVLRFALNSTFGLAGLIDWATPAGIPKHHQDFGLTLAHYGVPSGPYLVVPLFGPSDMRDVTDLAASSLLNPFAAAPTAVQASLAGVHVVSERANLLGTTDLLSQAALDEYSFTRTLYLGRRQALISGHSAGETPPRYSDAPAL
jgi:phospholipid-binding lipoprotein MlaA